jgi:hypothetical protein
LPNHDPAADTGHDIELLGRCRKYGPTVRPEICTQGGFKIDIIWKDGHLVTVIVSSLAGNPVALRCGEVTRELKLNAGEELQWDGK